MKQKRAEQKTDELKLENWNRKNVALILLFGIIVSGCSLDVELLEKARDVRAKELDAGPCTFLLRSTRKEPKSPFSLRHYEDSFRIRETTDTIAAVLNAQFGIEYILFAAKSTYAPVKIVWTFPEMINEKGKRINNYKYKRSQITHQRTWVAFSMHEPCMVVKGEFKLQIFHKKKMLLEKKFYLI